MNKKVKGTVRKSAIAIIALLVILIGVTVYFGRDYLFSNLSNSKSVKEGNKKDDDKNNSPPVPVKKLKIIDLDSKTRPIGVMIDNIEAAWPQAGLGDAYLVYEIIVEGGQTRLFALFKDVNTAMIGPVRSSRHYYLDYALENDAIYAHFGWSPQAQRDIPALGINNLNGMTNAGNAYWRATDVVAPHNVFTSIAKLTQSARNLGYRSEINKDTLLNYSVDEIDLSQDLNSKKADYVKINYSTSQNTSYEYDSTTKLYNRFMMTHPHVDKVTGKQYTVKNIIVIDVENHADPENSDKGRQALDNIGTGDGYYITDGYAIPITWSKSSRGSQTIYKKMSGEEIKVNDGNTYIQIQPLNQLLTIR